jgi:hypothetical protein
MRWHRANEVPQLLRKNKNMENDYAHPEAQSKEKADERLTSCDLFGWIDMAEKAPNPSDSCDFLYTGNEREENVWMMLSATLDDADEFEGIITYWRPASPLPLGVKRWKSLPNADVEASASPHEPTYEEAAKPTLRP